MITLTDLVLTYPDGGRRLTAVDHVSLTVTPGTVTGITGPSGSGKSSLLALAATLARPDSGTVRIGDVDATALTRDEATALRRDKIGIVFQSPNLLASLTAREQLLVMNELGAPGARHRRAAARAHADELLEAVGLADQADRRPHELSGGQRQRVNVARALVNSPEALLVDEPTSALDTERGAEIVDLIVRLTRHLGTATMLVTHDTEFLPRLDDVVRIVDGAVVPEAVAA